ncbi:hypothetical protein QNH39_22960 [Neobacillus novalis]|uniref:Uncharacterized protein n=1 Tax=Neobacillus novalis TaxID=220687 RepID=A0AA95MLL7_9BACI|nr:hypothetical protein [Neobacillus novalis]WHY85442.1 hypothetical protein QNH39_22960 [Neobacillus novalis]
MSHKKFLAAFAIMSTGLIVFVSVIMYIIDPLFYFRKTNLYRPQFVAAERYQMPGLLKNQDYDTVFTATSMGRNFRESYANEKFGGKSFNASLPASTAKEQSMVAEAALRTKPDLKRVIWELNYYSFSGDPNWVSGPPSDFPTYMYDQSKINDIRYLFSSYSVEILKKNLMANKTGDERWREVESLYKFGQVAPVETTEHIQTFLSNVQPIGQLPDYEKSSTLIKSFKENVISLVQAHPKTKFTLFYAPYPIYNHVSFYKKNPSYLAERLKFKKEVYELSRKYPNVEIYDFQDMKEITFNFANYQGDTVHYYSYINNWIIDYLVQNKPVQSEQEYAGKLKNFKQQITNFNINQLKMESSIKERYALKQ